MSKGKLDIIDKVLEACYKYNPDALFVMSLMHQYEERGSLSKKQLEGLLAKAGKVPDMPANWLATLEPPSIKCIRGQRILQQPVNRYLRKMRHWVLKCRPFLINIPRIKEWYFSLKNTIGMNRCLLWRKPRLRNFTNCLSVST